MKILILYPKEFNSYSKFSRKISKIISSLGSVLLVCANDFNGFVERFCCENPMVKGVLSSDFCLDDITHSIVFDDGEEFVREVEEIRSRSLPIRLVKIAITRVVNIKSEPKYQLNRSTRNYEYIGRGSYWGNPYSMYEEGDDRDEVIRKYKYDFDYEKFTNKEKSEVYKLAGKRLGCFCKPYPCHGDVLADFLNSWDDGK